MTTDAKARQKENLDRLLKPKTVAFVGLKDDSPFLPYVRRTVDHGDAKVYFVNPRYPEVLGHTTYASLADVPEAIDAVFVATGAEVAVQYAEEAAELGNVGGFISIANGFGEAGEEGKALQRRLVAAAEKGGFAGVGPNCLGLVNVPHQLSLTIAADHDRRPGGISVVSQSGALASGVAMSIWERPAIGINIHISAGNEAITDMADYLDYFADDPDTTAIALVIETIRRPKEFFAAAKRAIRNGKPIVALKLARSPRTQALAASHTGSLTGDAWVYEVAFKQLGIGLARTAEELADRLTVIQQLPEKHWSEVRRLGIITWTGGFASMTMDLATDEGIDVPALESLAPVIAELMPGITIPNPLDTGSGRGGPDAWPKVLDVFGESDEVDACLIVHPIADADEKQADYIIQAFADAADRHPGKPWVVANCATDIGQWAHRIVDASEGTASARGPLPALRGLETLGHFVRSRKKLLKEVPAPAPVVRPSGRTVREPEGSMLNFADSMEFLKANGIPVAPYHLIPVDGEVSVPSFAGPYVVKLADVGHRTEHGAVLLKITAEGLPEAVEKLRGIAAKDGLEPLVAVQPMVDFRGEAFIGIQNSELGPLVVFGLGGIFVEVLRKIGGRLAPFDRAEAEELIEEFRDAKLLHGFRGQPAWNLDKLADLLVAAGNLAAGSSEWLDSFDINPLLVVGDDYAAVDALLLVRD